MAQHPHLDLKAAFEKEAISEAALMAAGATLWCLNDQIAWGIGAAVVGMALMTALSALQARR